MRRHGHGGVAVHTALQLARAAAASAAASAACVSCQLLPIAGRCESYIHPTAAEDATMRVMAVHHGRLFWYFLQDLSGCGTWRLACPSLQIMQAVVRYWTEASADLRWYSVG
ncbi:hypothetical protein FHL15_009580 [Xylaria flabelliformis]|uniref:Secreted protein n=1 Tax=Xylaria flabelliformis TaxID=2512241 RepID=A0A553HNM2_9PEZI|nr:hypothetical protein FHL15_009580 [Xylaria flabelliformis]